MSEISLAVTKRVLEHAKPPRERERQIAYSDASPDVAARLASVSTKQRLKLRLGGRVTLVVADRGAIWRAHNDEYADDFDALLAFCLATHRSACGFFAKSLTEAGPEL